MSVQDPVAPADSAAYNQPALPRYRIASGPDGKKFRFPGDATDDQIAQTVGDYYRSQQEGPAPAPAPPEPQFQGRQPSAVERFLPVMTRHPARAPAGRGLGEAAAAPAEHTQALPVDRMLHDPISQAYAGAVQQVMPSTAGLKQVSPRTEEGVRQAVATIRSLASAARARGFEAPAQIPPGQTPPEPEHARNWTPNVAPPRNAVEQIARGLGSAAGYAGEAAALTPLVGPVAALTIPSVTGEGSVEQRLIRAGTMVVAGPILGKAAELSAGLPALGRAAVEVAAPAVSYGSIVPFADVAAQKALGYKVDWPTATDLVPSVATLGIFGAAMHAAGLGGHPPELPPSAGITGERAAAFMAITKHLQEPALRPDVAKTMTPEAMDRYRTAGVEASKAITAALGNRDISLTVDGQPTAVRLSTVKVYPFPGEQTKVRMVVEDVETGKIVPIGFKDLNGLRKSVGPLKPPVNAPGATRPPVRPKTQPGAPEPAPEPTATPEQANTGYLRLKQPGVAEELISHFAEGGPLHPVAGDALDRATKELSGVISRAEVVDMAQTSEDADHFRRRLLQKVQDRLPTAAPVVAGEGTAPQPEQPAARREAPEGPPEGAAPPAPTAPPEPPAAPEPPATPTHEEISMDQVDEVLADPAHRKTFERMASQGASDEELHAFLRKALRSRGIVLAEEEARPEPVTEESTAKEAPPEAPKGEDITRPGRKNLKAGEFVTIPHPADERQRVRGVVENYVWENGEPSVVVKTHGGKTRVVPEEKVLRRPKGRFSPLRQRKPELWDKAREVAGGDLNKALAIVEHLKHEREQRFQAALDTQLTESDRRSENRDRLRSAHAASMRALRATSEALEAATSVAYELGWTGPAMAEGTSDLSRYASEFVEGEPAPAAEPEKALSVKGLAEMLRKRIGIARKEEVPSGKEEVPPGGVAPSPGRGVGPGEHGGERYAGGQREPGGGAERRQLEEAPPAEPSPAPAGEWRPTIIEARAEHSQPANEDLIPEEFRSKLKPHQRQATAKMISAMIDHGGGLLASGTGAGKTRTELVVAEKLRRLGRAVLIVTPSEVIKQDWKSGSYAGSFYKDGRALGIDVRLWNEKYGENLQGGKIYITTLEQVHNIAPSDNLAIILDESHKFKNPSAKRTQHMLKMIDKAHSVLAASATPKDTINNLHYLVRSGILEGGTFAQMLDKIGLSLKTTAARPMADGEKLVAGDLVRFIPKEGLAYPRYPIEKATVESIENRNGVEVFHLTRETKGGQLRSYAVTKDMGEFYKFDATRIVPKKGVTAGMIEKNTEALFDRMVRDGRMVRHEISLEGVPIQITTLPTPREVADSMDELESEMTHGKGVDAMPAMMKSIVKMALRRHLEHLKVDKTVELANAEHARGRQVVIFAQRVNETIPNKWEKVWNGEKYVTVKVPLDKFKTPGTMPMLKAELERAGMTVGEIHGDMTKGEQLEAMRKFQAGELDAIIATPESGGTGIDLDHSDPRGRPRSLILMTPPFGADKYAQAIGRVIRSESISKPAISSVYFDHPNDSWGREIIERKLRDLGATVKGEIPKLAEGQQGEGPRIFESRSTAGGRRFVGRRHQPRGGPQGIPIPEGNAPLPTEEQARTLPGATMPPISSLPKGDRFKGIKEIMDTVTAALNPIHFAHPRAVDIVMEKKGDLERALTLSERATERYRSFWEGRAKPQVMSFLDNLEHGLQQHPWLEKLAEQYRERSDNLFNAIIKYKGIPYYENWFPHLWKDPAKAKEFYDSYYQRRPLEGTKRFLRKRFYSDYRAGIEAGLEPRSWNPEDLMRAAEHDVRKYVMVQELRRALMKQGSIRFATMGARAGRGDLPADFEQLDGAWAKLYLPPEVEVHEYFDKHVMETLEKVSKDMGLTHTRKPRIGGRRLGYAVPGPGGGIVTRAFTPEDVLAHEIGHKLDERWGLAARFGARYNKELTALADLRAEGIQIGKSFKNYLHRPAEKMAVMLQAYVHAPERFKEVAPRAYDAFRLELALHPETKPLVNLKPSLVYGKATHKIGVGGVVQGGSYWAQKDVARILNNHMSADWIMSNPLGRSVMASRNTLNLLQLGASGFHATGITMISVMNRVSAALSELASGHPIQFAKKLATAPIAPIEYMLQGRAMLKAGERAGSGAMLNAGDALMDKNLRDAYTGGARLRRQEYYKQGALDNFLKNSRIALKNQPPLQRVIGGAKALPLSPFVALEGPMRILSTEVIPQMKLGAQRELMEQQMRLRADDLKSGKVTEAQLARETWNNIENRMGQLNYDNLFYNRALKSSIMLLIRAPGWTLGTLREFGGATFIDLPKMLEGEAPTALPPRPAFALAMMFTTLAVGGLYHYLHTGKVPQKPEDYIHPMNGAIDAAGRAIRIDFPTYWKDVVNWYTHPGRTALGGYVDRRGQAQMVGHGGKLAPEIPLALDLYANQSHRGPIRRPFGEGRRASDFVGAVGDQTSDVVKYLYQTNEPFSLQQYSTLSKGHATPEEKAESFMGITRHAQGRK